MKKLLLLLAVTLAFTFTALAQTDTSQTGGTSGQTTTKTKTKKSKTESGGAAASEQGAAKPAGGKAKKEASLTGCISAQPDSSGNYTLSNGRYKKGVEVGPSDKVKDHAGHQVQLKGEWKAAAGGETAGGGTTKAAAKSKSFDVASVNHLSDTCKEATPGGGTTGATKKGEKDMKKGKAKGATPPGF